MAVRQGALDRQRVLGLGHGDAAAQQGAQALDKLLRPTAEVGKCALLDPAPLAIAFAEQDGGARIPVRNAFDMHDISNHHQSLESIHYVTITWLHARASRRAFPFQIKHLN
jgi:hypothetical protein